MLFFLELEVETADRKLAGVAIEVFIVKLSFILTNNFLIDSFEGKKENIAALFLSFSLESGCAETLDWELTGSSLLLSIVKLITLEKKGAIISLLFLSLSL